MLTRIGGSLFAGFDQHLCDLERKGQRRRLTARQGHDFASNDYLGLAGSPALRTAVAEALARGVPIGSGGSRLLRGNHPEHQMLEQEAADFFGSPTALFFSSGYTANSALLSTLPQRGDLIIHDALIHASSHEGMRLSRAEARRANHNDIQSFADVLLDWRKSGGTGRPWLAVESLYSMEGDKAPLTDLLSVANQNDGFLIIDEAHATGVFGDSGRGLAEGFDGKDNVITVRTCGKALGCEGALICAPRAITDFLINRGRGFIFSTAPSPLMAAAVRQALKTLQQEQDRRVRLHDFAAHAAARLGPLGARCHGTQILPLIVGEAATAMELAGGLQEAGFDVRGIRPPTVPEGTSRLRISITLNVDKAAISALADTIGTLLA
ncbi:MAG TPA: 8-amino-7-oxononanoate synthase [Sphingomicrobium sp.]